MAFRAAHKEIARLLPTSVKKKQLPMPFFQKYKRIHVIVVNGDDEKRHKKTNVGDCISAMESRGVKEEDFHIVGLYEKGVPGNKYRGTKKGLEKALEKVKGNYGENDLVLVYVTGHGNIMKLKDEEEPYVRMVSGKLTRSEFTDMFREVTTDSMFVFDFCYGGGFPDSLMNSGVKGYAMAPMIEGKKCYCHYFAPYFWDAIKRGVDIDGNKISSPEEAFNYAMNVYRTHRGETLGTFRKSIEEITTKEQILEIIKSDKPIIVDFYADWCGPCKRMKKSLNALQAIYGDEILIYGVDVEKMIGRKAQEMFGAYVEKLPTLAYIKGKKLLNFELGVFGVDELDERVNKFFKMSIKPDEVQRTAYERAVEMLKGNPDIDTELEALKLLYTVAANAIRLGEKAPPEMKKLRVDAEKKIKALEKKYESKLFESSEKAELSKEVLDAVQTVKLKLHTLEHGKGKILGMLKEGVEAEYLLDVFSELRINSAAPEIIKAMKKSRKTSFRGACVFALGKLEHKSIVPALIEMLKTEKNRDILNVYLPTALVSKGKKAVPYLEKLVYEKKRRSLNAAEILGIIGQDALPVIEKIVADKNFEIRKLAVASVIKLDSPKQVKLFDKLVSDKDKKVRSRALNIVSGLSGKYPQLIPSILKLTKDKDAGIKKEARNHLLSFVRISDFSNVSDFLEAGYEDEESGRFGSTAMTITFYALGTKQWGYYSDMLIKGKNLAAIHTLLKTLNNNLRMEIMMRGMDYTERQKPEIYEFLSALKEAEDHFPNKEISEMAGKLFSLLNPMVGERSAEEVLRDQILKNLEKVVEENIGMLPEGVSHIKIRIKLEKNGDFDVVGIESIGEELSFLDFMKLKKKIRSTLLNMGIPEMKEGSVQNFEIKIKRKD